MTACGVAAEYYIQQSCNGHDGVHILMRTDDALSLSTALG